MPIDKERTIQCYDTFAPLYSFFRKITHKSDTEIMPFVLDTLDPGEDEVVLDAGTGPGIYAIKMAERVPDAKIYGVDLSPTFLKLAKKNALEAGISHIEFIQGDIENLPFGDNRFDKLVCGGAMEAVPDKERAARELYRVLKPGKTAVFIEPDRGKDLRDRAFLLFLYGLGLINPRLRGFTAKDIPKYYFNRDSFYSLFKSAGFTTVEIVKRAGSFCAVCMK